MFLDRNYPMDQQVTNGAKTEVNALDTLAQTCYKANFVESHVF